MVSQDKLIKQGIKYTDSLFAEISKRLEQGVRQCDTLEEFLSKYKEYTDGKGENNPLVLNGYKDQMLKIILAETNNHKFSRPSQKELARVVIENRVGDLITDVGEDIQGSVRDIVKEGYNNNLSQDEIAEQITHKVDTIKTKRARAIARTEIARTATISDYIINKERGATHFYVECRNTACPVCKEAWHNHWSEANDESFKPKDQSAGGKGWIGDKTYSMNDTKMLPPIHPNCRCVPYFISEDDVKGPVEPISLTKPTTVTETVEPTNETTTTESKTMLQGEPTIQKQGNGTLYTYENGFELYVSDKSIVSYDELITHIKSLPEPLKNMSVIKRLDFTPDVAMRGKSGEYIPQFQKLCVYHSQSKNRIFEVLNHELGHALDNQVYVDAHKNWRGWGLSNVEVYDKIFKADNKLKEYTRPNGKKRIPNRLVTDYAGRSWKKFKKKFSEHLKVWKKGSQDPNHKPQDMRYMEDFAESTQLYLSPATHDQFVKDYPNRAKYLEEIYGKVEFDKNSPYYKALQNDGVI